MNALLIWFKKFFCKHTEKTQIFICYQDRYVREICVCCGEEIYSDL